MKILTLHCDYIRFKPVKKALKIPEELTEARKKEPPSTLMSDVIKYLSSYCDGKTTAMAQSRMIIFQRSTPSIMDIHQPQLLPKKN